MSWLWHTAFSPWLKRLVVHLDWLMADYTRIMHMKHWAAVWVHDQCSSFRKPYLVDVHNCSASITIECDPYSYAAISLITIKWLVCHQDSRWFTDLWIYHNNTHASLTTTITTTTITHASWNQQKSLKTPGEGAFASVCRVGCEAKLLLESEQHSGFIEWLTN